MATPHPAPRDPANAIRLPAGERPEYDAAAIERLPGYWRGRAATRRALADDAALRGDCMGELACRQYATEFEAAAARLDRAAA